MATKPIGSELWPVWYQRFDKNAEERTHRNLRRALLSASWLQARTLGWTVSTNGTKHLGLNDKDGLIVLPTHRSLLDSWLVGITFQQMEEFFHIMRHDPDKALWHLPEMNNFQFTWLTHLFIGHLNCVPVQRGNSAQQSGVLRRIKRGLQNGHRYELFATAGRESKKNGLSISKEVAETILWYCEGGKVQVVTAEIRGVPVWNGERMGGDNSSRLLQFWQTYWTQIFGRLIHVHYERFDMGPYLNREVTDDLLGELGIAICDRIRPKYPKNPADVLVSQSS
jgi:hypothetical protein